MTARTCAVDGSGRIRCVICAKRDPEPGWIVDRGCLNRIDDDLARILELTRFAADLLTPEGRTGNGGSRPVPGSRPPLDLCALDAALGLDAWPVLESWQRIIREANGLARYGAATEAAGATLAQSVGFLRSWLLWAAESPAFPIEELAREVREQRMYLDRYDPEFEAAGLRIPCPSDHPDADGRVCGYRLTIDARMLRDDVECRRCGTTWTTARLILRGLSDPAVTVWAYPDVITEFLGLHEATLRQWHKRGHIKRNGSRYDVGAAFRRNHGDAV